MIVDSVVPKIDGFSAGAYIWGRKKGKIIGTNRMIEMARLETARENYKEIGEQFAGQWLEE